MAGDECQQDMGPAEGNVAGQFTCSNNGHRARGEKFFVNGRALCKRCKELRDRNHAAAMKKRRRLLG